MPLSTLVEDVLDNRARLIAQETSVSLRVQSALDAMKQRWVEELRRLVRRRNKSESDIAQIRRMGIALNRLGAITDSELRKIQPIIASTTKAIYRNETFRHAEMLHGHVFEAKGAIEVGFNEISTRAVESAMRGTIAGVDQVLGLTSASVKQAMKRDLVDAIAKGWNVNQLASKWSSTQGAASVAKHQVDGLARTAMMAASNNAAIAQYAKSDLVQYVKWEAAFDSRVCLVCAALSGRVFDIKKAPPMPAHFRCRCAWLPVFKDTALNREFDVTAYVKRSGQLAYKRENDRRFETWLDAQGEQTQRAFFPSEYKFKVWDQNKLALDRMVNRDGTIKSDDEVRRQVLAHRRATQSIKPNPPL